MSRFLNVFQGPHGFPGPKVNISKVNMQFLHVYNIKPKSGYLISSYYKYLVSLLLFLSQGEPGLHGAKGTRGEPGHKGDRGPLGLPVSETTHHRASSASPALYFFISLHHRDPSFVLYCALVHTFVCVCLYM